MARVQDKSLLAPPLCHAMSTQVRGGLCHCRPVCYSSLRAPGISPGDLSEGYQTCWLSCSCHIGSLDEPANTIAWPSFLVWKVPSPFDLLFFLFFACPAVCCVTLPWLVFSEWQTCTSISNLPATMAEIYLIPVARVMVMCLCEPTIIQSISFTLGCSCARSDQDSRVVLALCMSCVLSRRRQTLDYALHNGSPADPRSCSAPQ